MAVGERVLPLSYGQLGLWFAQTLDPAAELSGGQYVEIHGSIAPGLFERALRHVIDEADALRLRFVDDPQGPRQIIGAYPDWTLPIVDVSAEPDPRGAAEAWMAADMRRRVDLSTGPLFTFVLFRAGPDRWLWYQCYHHLVSDGFGRWLITTRAADIYAALDRAAPDAGARFGSLENYLGEDAAYRASAQYAEDRRYWLDAMSSSPRPAGLAKRAATAGPTVRATVRVSASVKDVLRRLARSAGSTLPQAVSAAIAAYVCRMTDADEVVLGVAVRNRVTPLAKRTPGMTSNILPLRVKPRLDLGMGELVRQIATTMREAIRHQRYRIEEVRRDLGLHAAGHDLFWPAVNYQGFDYDLRIGGHRTTIHSLPQPWTENLTIIVHDRSQSSDLEIDFDANGSLYDAEVIARHAAHVRHLLESVTPDRPVGSLEIMSASARRRLIEEFNAASRPHAAQSVAELFDAWAGRIPDALAVVCEAEQLTYGELKRRADRLARRIAALGARRETRIALYLDRGAELVVALLGVLKAGAAYVPLDPASPPERLAHVLADSGAQLMLTQATRLPSLPADMRGAALCVDRDEGRFARASAAPLEAGRRPEDLAYVTYTSGSTGMPKGIGVPHGAIVNLVHNEYVTLGAGDRIGQASNASFDALTFEVWGALLNGGTIVTIAHDVAVSPPALRAAIRRHRIDTLFLTTALFNEVIREAPDAFEGVRDLLFGGEAVDPQWVRTLLRQRAVRRLLHVYGPTEMTTFSTWHHTSAVSDAATTVPIGRPIRNARAYVLDRHLQIVPLEGVGELYVAGAGMARGYWNRPGFSADRFVADPFGPPGGRMYRTGDLVRWRASGGLEFIGRRDDQVKLRGFRVEPAEIEAALRRHPDVRDAVVVVREQASGDKRLVGFVVSHAGHTVDGSLLRHQLAQVLPPYMVPSTVIVLDAIPLTPTGKVDRRALPSAPEIVPRHDRAPRTPEEEFLCEAFADVLGVARVGLDDDFFDLGGHSLLATRVVSRIRATLGVELAISTLFESSTVGDLAFRLREAGEPRAPLVAQERPVPLPASYAQQRLWFVDRLEGACAAYHMQDTLRLRGPLDRVALARAIDTIAARHESLRTYFAEVDGSPVQIVAPAAPIAVALEDLQSLAGQAQAARIQHVLRREREVPFDLTRGPLLRVRLMELGPDDHVLVRTFHHIASDGWSQGVFNRELMTLYAAYRDGQPNPLPTLRVQYADFALWQRRRVEEGALSASLAYWIAQLAEISERPLLPTDRPRADVQTFFADRYDTVLPAAATTALRHVCQQHHVTLYMMALAAFGVLLARYSGQDDLTVGSPIANRQDEALEDLLGCFVNPLVLRLRVAPHQPFTDLLLAVRQTALDGYRHQDVPFERVVEALAPARRVNTPPLFQLTFALQNAPMPVPRLAGLDVEPVVADDLRVRFDLEVHAFEHEGEVRFSWVYNVALFDRWRIAQLARHYARVLAAVCANPSVRVGEIPLLDETERQQALEAWNATRQPPPRLSIPALFEAQASRTPDAIAVVDGERAISYGTLNARANRWSRLLAARGIGAENVVALALPRSLELIVSCLAVLKTGAAYLPLDPSEPAGRQTYMLRDAHAVAAIASEPPTEPWPASLHVIPTDTDLPAYEARSESSPVRMIPDHLAYVMYTSGSTGVPKGIMVTHGAIAHLVLDTNYIALQAGDRVAQIATASFDAATFEIWGALLNGGTLVMIDTQTALSPADFAATVAAERITAGFLTTALFHQIVREQPDAFAGLQSLLFGGEVADPRRVRDILGHGAPGRLVHVYGPTEATTFASWCALDPGALEGGTAPIGTPISGTRLYVLDPLLAVVPPGVDGELYIAGPGLARGYVAQTAPTAMRFVADPFGPPGTRMYRTGDRARWRADGRLEFVGRVDRQLKIRGFRVEPDEIEAALLQHAGVRDCAVMVRGDGASKQMVAYWIAAAGSCADRTDLRQHMKQRVPHYMLPADFIRIDAWPLTSHGKIDAAALPGPGETTDEACLVGPQDDVQAVMIDVWKEALERQDVSIFDNYFDLGAHSLMVLHVQSELSKRLNVRLRVIDLFTYSTVASLAEYVRTQRDGTPGASLADTPRPLESVDAARGGRQERLAKRIASRQHAS